MHLYETIKAEILTEHFADVSFVIFSDRIQPRNYAIPTCCSCFREQRYTEAEHALAICCDTIVI